MESLPHHEAVSITAIMLSIQASASRFCRFLHTTACLSLRLINSLFASETERVSFQFGPPHLPLILIEADFIVGENQGYKLY